MELLKTYSRTLDRVISVLVMVAQTMCDSICSNPIYVLSDTKQG